MDHQTHASSSTFVTALAWIFIVLAAFATFVCVAESIMVAIVLPPGTRQVLAQADHFGDFGRLVLTHLQALLFAMLLLFVLTLVTAIGLLKRWPWARIVFIGLMLLGVVWNAGGALLIYYFVPSAADFGQQSSVQVAQFNVLRNLVFIFDLLASIAFIALFAWIARRLASDDVRREFRPD